MNERLLTYFILYNFEKTSSRLDDLTRDTFRNHTLSSQQKRYIKNISSGVLRIRNQLDFYISSLYHGKFSKLLLKVKSILRPALFEIMNLDNIPQHSSVDEYVKLAKKEINPKTASLVNAILRNFIRQREKLEKDFSKITSAATRLNFPEWLFENWQNNWGSEFTEDLCRAFNEIPGFDLRINRQKITAEAFEKLLSAEEIAYSRSALPGYYKIDHIGRVIEAGLLLNGLCSVQDESAAIPVKMLDLNKKDLFLDACSAPGGKFTQALENCPDIELAVAVDNDISRIRVVQDNLKRLDLKGFVVVADARNLPFKNKFTKILLDAPCSGQGIIGKHPDIKWRRKKEEIHVFNTLQNEILAALTEFLENSGTLAYATCSIDPAENERVMESFLLSHKEFDKSIDNNSKMKLPFGKVDHGIFRTFPHLDQTDGSALCLLEKTRC